MIRAASSCPISEAIEARDALYFHGGVSEITIWAPDVLLAIDGWDNAKLKCRKLLEGESAGRGRRK
jgi:MraZ protein